MAEQIYLFLLWNLVYVFAIAMYLCCILFWVLTQYTH